MTPRTKLALCAAVLACTAGSVVGGGTPWAGSDAAVAAVPVRDAAPVVVTESQLRGVDAIELGAESLVLRAGDHTVVRASMRDSALTVGLLDRLLGTPSRTQTAEGDGGACFPAGTTYTWRGAVRVAALTTTARIGNAVEIRVLRDAVRSRWGSTVELSGPDGVRVGEDIRRAIADAPRSARVSYGSDDAQAWQLLLREGWERTDRSHRADRAHSGRNGVSALTDETTVTVLGSPMPVHAQRSC
ncbi:hypothetical protein BIU97_07830 [Curtobacterium sp. MCBA15_009]|uniref:hypothetical protein n=1 Tax=Curtobacterium sp. MCBA15_009 TaxID=1898737 RepID=UPI0008DD6A18|nr:hypothetical protein [Curtobacterium sp. MCBA15_009]OII11758.1 hypothetical protein BIU97_07830 [Curtobacterium sp. MCBA15_009]